LEFFWVVNFSTRAQVIDPLTHHLTQQLIKQSEECKKYMHTALLVNSVYHSRKARWCV